MSESGFRIIPGLFLVAGLCFDLHGLVWGLVGLLVFEGVTNWRVAQLPV